ncbi:CD1375 family protein [Alkalihalophilus pseudofirmus]|nr:CD1375 family protein [Alkalihalophilus pseudofirmus]WEG18478.1 CD1375 family protein [Alkalihalophilus pseudofirmus]
MVEMYVRLIRNSEEKGNEDWTIDRVPERFREDVKTALKGGN